MLVSGWAADWRASNWMVASGNYFAPASNTPIWPSHSDLGVANEDCQKRILPGARGEFFLNPNYRFASYGRVQVRGRKEVEVAPNRPQLPE